MKTVLVVGASRGLGHEFVRAVQAATAGACSPPPATRARARRPRRQLGAQTYSRSMSRSPEQVAALAGSWTASMIDVAIIVSGVYGPRTRRR